VYLGEINHGLLTFTTVYGTATSTRLPYRQTGAFSKIALDYIDQAAALKHFFTHPPTLQGIQKAIESRKKFDTDRKFLSGN
jgi:hypothetical protein